MSDHECANFTSVLLFQYFVTRIALHPGVAHERRSCYLLTLGRRVSLDISTIDFYQRIQRNFFGQSRHVFKPIFPLTAFLQGNFVFQSNFPSSHECVLCFRFSFTKFPLQLSFLILTSSVYSLFLKRTRWKKVRRSNTRTEWLDN